MKDLNRVILIGRLGADPVQRETRGGIQVTHFSVATSRRKRAESSGGDAEAHAEETVWHQVVVWSRQAEHCAQYLRKGSPIYVEGSIRTRRYQDKEGTQRTAFEIHANNVGFLGDAPRRGDASVENDEGSLTDACGMDEAPFDRQAADAIG